MQCVYRIATDDAVRESSARVNRWRLCGSRLRLSRRPLQSFRLPSPMAQVTDR